MCDTPSEWTFEEARKQWTTMVRPVQHVGVPGYQFQAGVMWDGSLVFGPLHFLDLKVMQQEIAPLGDHFLHLSVAYGDPMRFADRKGTGTQAIRRSLEGGRLPIPHVITRNGDLDWQESVFAHLLGRPYEEGMTPQSSDILVVRTRFKVRNTGHARRTGHLWLHFGDTSQVYFGYKCKQGEEIAPAISHRYASPYGLMEDKIRYILPTPGKGTVRWHDAVSHAEGIQGTPRNVIEWEVPLAPGEEAEITLTVPYGLISPENADKLLKTDWEGDFREACRFWEKLLYGPGQITTPDPFINDYLVAVAGQMAEQVAYRTHSTKVWMYKTSPNHYEGYWPCNATKALPTFDLRGLTEISRRVLQSFIDCQTDDVRGMEKGVMGRDEKLPGEGFARLNGFLGNFGEWTANPVLLSHGLGLWAIASHYRITRDKKWLGSGPGSPLESMISGFEWVSAQRRRTMRDENGQKIPYWGLLPAASAHDWLAGNTIFNDAFCLYGMAEVVRLLREINHPRAEELAGELSDYRACLRDRYREARDRARTIPLPDGTSLPFVPRIVQELDWIKPDWTYTGYGPLRAGAWGALEPDDEMVEQSLAFLEAGMPQGEGPYFAAHKDYADIADINWADISDPAAERHHMWRHYVEYETMWPIGAPLFLARDDLPRFFEWLFHNLSVALHPDWRVGVESLDGVPSCAPGDGERWQAIRRMFVNERGGYDGSQQSLWLLQAIPRSWLRPGSRMAITDMGTYFGGNLNLEVQVSDNGDSVRATVRLKNLSVLPTEIRLRLRSGDGRPLASILVNDNPAKLLEGDTVRLPLKKNGTYQVVGGF
ncbi:MAG: hypothetical protein IT210_25620 [Armatimonadetes bacterium]|nr:hypothetical protein [Armatimonadota bacterium]